MKSKYKGYIAVIVSGIIFGLMPLVAKLIFNNGGNPISLVFYRFLFTLPILYLINKKQNISIKITKEELKLLIIVSIFGYSATAILLFLSYNYISTGLATTLHFVYPIFVTIGCIIFFKEKVNLIKSLSAVLCTIGISLFVEGFSINNQIIGIILSFLSGITYAFYMILIEKSSLKDIPPFKLTFYLCLISSGIVLIYSLITKTFTSQISLYGWILTVIFSMVVSVGAVTLIQVGINIIGAQSAAILSTFEPITSVLIGAIIFSEPLNLRRVLGIGTIILSVVLLAREKESDLQE